MRLTLLAAIAAIAMLPGSACAAGGGGSEARSEAPTNLRWEIEEADRPDMVQLELSHRSPGRSYTTGRPVRIADLQGLDPSAAGQVHFRLMREAGTFDCEGVMHRRNGVGECRFLPDSAFAAGLARRGMGEATPYQLFSLAMGDIGLAYADELERQHYARPSVQDLVDAGNHGASIDYLRSMGGLGYRVGTLAALIRMRDHGVTEDYVRELVGAGLRDIPADTLVQMRDHGVSPTYIGELRRHGYGDLPVMSLIALRDHGVGADYVAELDAGGIRGIPIDDLVRMRDHGVSPDYIVALRRSGWSRLSTDEIVRLRDHGVTAGFVAELRSLGYGDVRVDDIIRLRDMGVTADFIRRSNAAGRRSPDELVRLRTGG